MIRKIQTIQSLAGIGLVMLLCGTLLAIAVETEARQEVIAVEGATYNVNISMAENLKLFVGKTVYISLDSGKVFIGSVKEVGNHLVHLEKLVGKEYFDALIRIESINAIDSRFREIKRESNTGKGR